jgi:anti-sigma factor RsiW
MNEDQLLKLQAWVDGELPEGEARAVAALIETNPEARAVVAELRMTHAFIGGNEPETALPESREFYWSKIQRAIEREAATTTTTTPDTVSWVAVLRRYLTPVSGLALIAFLSVLSLNLFQRPGAEDPLQHLVEVENLSEHVGSISYKSQAENMFVVYLYNKDQDVENDEEFEPLDEPVLQ